VRAREVNARIEARGGVAISQRGSHRKYRAETTRGGTRVSAITIVAQHPGDIPTGTLRKIEKDLEPVFGERWLTK
jgi:predicted RNA binding protein YcfA (HicA-like mRNA interferase family)